MDIVTSDILLIVVVVVWLVFATLTDIKKREVPNWLSFSLIAIAFVIRALTSILTGQTHYFTYAIIAFILFFLLANLLYYIKFFGGGDAKLLMALAVVFATAPSFVPILSVPAYSSLQLTNEPFLLSYLINSFTIGAIYSLAFIAFFVIKDKKNFLREFKKINKENKSLRIYFLLAAAAFLILTFFTDSPIFVALFLISLVFPYIFIIAKATEKVSMIRSVSPRELTEGDWLIQKIKIKNTLIKPSAHGLDAKDIALLKKSNKKVLIKYGIPFVPVFLIALICTLLFGDLLILLVRVFFF